ncbi:MAG: tRNA 2-thiouridine(34) synthase MnmA [bacterium]
MKRTAVLMSGGVDSSLAAWLLKEAGRDLTGITAKMWEGGSRCCDQEDIYRAERVCHRLGIPHVVLDLTGSFERFVVEPFVESYMAGHTPNPCAECNREVKLGRLLGRLARAGFERVATGHYASIAWRRGRPLLSEPRDRDKSQIYFLSLIRPEVLGHLEFPLHDLSKPEVGARVVELGLPARRGESQDLCFVSSGRYDRLLSERSADPGPGEVLDAGGHTVGTHRGHHAYTIGQRFGLRGKRYYVIEKRAESNQIVVGERHEAMMSTISAAGLNLFVPPDLIESSRLEVKYRYNSPAVRARVVEISPGRLTVRTEEACFAPAPGQILAGYDGDCLVFGGIIESAAP